jgi:hypothetical protein
MLLKQTPAVRSLTVQHLKKKSMKRRPEFYISGIRYNSSREQIEIFRRHKSSAQEITECDYISRNALIEDLKRGINYMTAHVQKKGSLRAGTYIRLVMGKYLRGDLLEKEEDHLGSLPEI